MNILAKLLILIDADIKRCEDILKSRNYLEIVIAVEEIVDKYKDKIKSIDEIGKDKVWNYTSKDLEVIKNKLEAYRNDIIENYNKNIIGSKISINELIIELKENAKNNTKYSPAKINDIMDKINTIELIRNENISIDVKWFKLKDTMLWIANEDAETASKFLNIVQEILRNKN